MWEGNDMVTEYVDCAELKRLIEDKKLKPATLKYYLRQKGIVFTANNAEQFAEQVYTIFLGAGEISEIRDMMANETNYEKSMVINLVLKQDSEEDIIDVLMDELNNQKSMKSEDYNLEQPVRTEDGAYINLYYTRKLPGRNRLLEYEKRFLRLNVRKISQHEVVVDIRQQSSIDSKNAIKFVEQVSKTESLLNLKHINLELLSSRNKAEFFDRIAAYEFKLWRLKTITGITVKQGIIDEDEEENDLLIDENDESSTLSGISQAVLNGSGLRSNEFVQESINKGYYISAMRYRYEHKTDMTEFAVILRFQNQDLRVDIDKTYLEDEGRIYVQPFVKSEQNDIVVHFQNAAYQVFEKLLEEQNHE